ncbi:MAG: hypothetical protein Alpg2KO_24960 [Alphaproteobacteria bacterium]
MLFFVTMCMIILAVEKSSKLIYSVGFLEGDVELVEADLYRHNILVFEGFGLEVKSRLIANRILFAPGMGQLSLDSSGNIVSEGLGKQALYRASELHGIWEMRCDTDKVDGKEICDCVRLTHNGRFVKGVDIEDRSKLSDTLLREGLAWVIGNSHLQRDACDSGLGLWAGGPYQIPPDVWRGGNPDIRIKDLPIKHCYEGLENSDVLFIGEGGKR